MPEEQNNNSIEKSLAGTLKPEAEKHPMFRTQTEQDSLRFVFDIEPITDTKDLRDGGKK
ncbi:MAG: hypothetical protein IJF84_00220 [Thermoguttaceae bacterium]|nr:hypothetical protein [Thermoguttaceae bacterium]